MLNEELFDAITHLIVEKDLGPNAPTQVKLEYMCQHNNIKFTFRLAGIFGPSIAMTRQIDDDETYTIIVSLINGKIENSKATSQALFDMYNLLTAT